MGNSGRDQQMTGQTTDSGSMPALQSQSSARPTDPLAPASRDDFRRELTSCLALCAPAGFDETTRREWLTAAWATLKDVPADLLARGCKVARTYSDHPSKIIPSIMREIERPWEMRKKANRPELRVAMREAKQIGEVVTAQQLSEIKAEFGLATNPYPEQPKPVGERRMPSRADYIALGVDPVVLDALPAKVKAA